MIMATYEKSGAAIVWQRKGADRNLPTLEEILEAARREFPDCRLIDLELLPCGECVLLEKRMI